MDTLHHPADNPPDPLPPPDVIPYFRWRVAVYRAAYARAAAAEGLPPRAA